MKHALVFWRERERKRERDPFIGLRWTLTCSSNDNEPLQRFHLNVQWIFLLTTIDTTGLIGYALPRTRSSRLKSQIERSIHIYLAPAKWLGEGTTKNLQLDKLATGFPCCDYESHLTMSRGHHTGSSRLRQIKTLINPENGQLFQWVS